MFATLSSFRRPAALLRQHFWAILAGVGMVAGFCAAKIGIARIIGATIDDLSEGGDADDGTLTTALLLLVAVIVAEAVCRYFARRLIIDASRQIEARLKRDLMAHMSKLPMSWYDRAKTGDLLSRLTQDVELIRFLIGPSILYGAQALVMVPGCVYLMATISGTVTLAITGAFGALLVAMVLLMPRLQKYSKRVQEDIGDISQHAQESFAGIQVLLQFAKGSVFARRLDGLNEKYVRDNVAMTRFRALVHLFVHLCTDLVLLSVLVLGAMEVIEGRMTTGGLFQFLVLMGYLVWPLIALGWILGVVHRARSAADRVEEILSAPTEAALGRRVSTLGALSVRDLTFTYSGEEKPALRNISFELPAGKKLGLVGPVGSGKSTLLHLILRLYEPPRGTVFVDDVDVLDLDLSHLRRRFAFAPQDPFLFSDTVADNVRFGMSETETSAEREAVFEAVRASALEQDVESLAEGLETVVGERGVTLSGGQKQRVALARALVADRPVVMLDDTLSAVDHHTEERILERLGETARGKTLLIASHRLSAIADADLILVLTDGAVTERGTHADLMRANGDYAAAYRLQREEQALGGPS